MFFKNLKPIVTLEIIPHTGILNLIFSYCNHGIRNQLYFQFSPRLVFSKRIHPYGGWEIDFGPIYFRHLDWIAPAKK